MRRQESGGRAGGGTQSNPAWNSLTLNSDDLMADEIAQLRATNVRLEKRLDCGGTSNSPVLNIVADGIVQLIDTTSLTNVRFPDGWIRVVGVDIPVNRCVLAARSPVFAAAFESGMQNDAIFSIDEYDEKTVRAFLECFYTGWNPREMMIMAVDLFKLAHFFQMPHLVNLIEAELINQLSIDTLCTSLQQAATLREYYQLSGDRGRRYTLLLEACIDLSICFAPMLISRLDWQELMNARHPMYDLVAPLLPRCLPIGAADHFVLCINHSLDDIDIIAYPSVTGSAACSGQC